VFGVVAAFAVFFLKKMTGRLLADKPLYVFAIHTGGGTVGMILTGVFARYVNSISLKLFLFFFF